jgi:hypothetical protein
MNRQDVDGAIGEGGGRATLKTTCGTCCVPA